MEIPIFQVDAFASEVFRGNPAAVCPLQTWPEDELLQKIAAENNLSETAFFVPESDGVYTLRWFTPAVEVDLCGHATLASAYVIFHYLNIHLTEVRFETASGSLLVRREGPLLTLDLPSRKPLPCEMPAELVEALGARPVEILKARDLLAVFESESDIRQLSPDFRRLSAVDAFGIIVTARGEEVDFVSRFFAPREGIPEDPVTGSAHCTLVPYWSGRLGKKQLTARQISSRGGELSCEDLGSRVKLAGEAVIYLEGTITI